MTVARLKHFAELYTEKFSIRPSVDEAIRILARDAGFRGAHDLPAKQLGKIWCVEHPDGSLERVDLIAD
jgi:hypothetical protein